jgi:hypothetical protein
VDDNGKISYIETVKYRIRDPKSKSYQVLGFGYDVTEREIAQNMLDKANVTLQEKNNALKNLEESARIKVDILTKKVSSFMKIF